MFIDVTVKATTKTQSNLPFFAVFEGLVLGGVVLVDHAGEAELLIADPLDLTKLV